MLTHNSKLVLCGFEGKCLQAQCTVHSHVHEGNSSLSSQRNECPCSSWLVCADNFHFPCYSDSAVSKMIFFICTFSHICLVCLGQQHSSLLASGYWLTVNVAPYLVFKLPLDVAMATFTSYFWTWCLNRFSYVIQTK